jgi:glycine cleavage system regulatory protein
LGGKFAGVVRVAIPAAHTAALAAALNALEAEGLTVWTALDESPAPSHRQAATLHLTGADKPGIVKQVAQALAEKGVNVEEFESSLGEAPWSGAPVFQATARLALPPQLALSALRQALEAVSADLMVDITVQTP